MAVLEEIKSKGKIMVLTGSLNITPDPIPERKDKGVQEFFESLGYYVGWDHNRHGSWFELHDDGIVAQVDMGVPLEFIVEDMIAWHLEKEPEDRPEKPDWTLSGQQGPEMKELFKRVYDFKVKNQMPNGQLNMALEI